MRQAQKFGTLISKQSGMAILLAATLCLSLAHPPSAFATRDDVVRLNNDGVNALKANNWALATQKFMECLKLDPTYKLARENMAICYNNWGIQLQNNPAQAIEKFHKSLFYSPDNPTAVQNLEVTVQNLGKDPRSFKDRLALGKQARVAGDFEGAAVEYGEALKIKDDPKVRIDLGDVLRVRDRIDDAINQYKVAAKSQGLDLDSQVKAWTSLGQCYQAKKDYPNSVAAYNEAIKLNRTDKETLEANRAVWAEAVQKDPVNAGNHVGLGQAYSYLGDFDQARAEYMQALVFDKTNQAAQQLLSTLPLAKKEFDRDKHVNNGVDLQSRKLYDAAIQEYTAALGIDTSLPPKERTSADIMVNLGSAFQAKEDYKTAIDWYNKALSIKPDYTAAQEGLKNSKERLVSKQLDDAASQGATFFKSGNFNEALKCYQMLENANPKDAAAHFNVAATLQALKQIDLAIAEFKQAVSIAPDNKQYKEFLNKAMQDKADPIIDMAVKKHADKDYTSAIALYLQALQIVPDNQKVQFNLAGAYYSRQQFPEAQKLYEQLYQKDPKGQVDDLWLIGTILENAKRGNDALADYTKYVTEAPTGTYVAQAKARIDALRKDPTDCIKIKSPEELAREKDADDSYKAAIKAQQEKRWDDASQLYMKTLSLRPNDPAVMFDYGTMFQAKKDLDSALKWFQSAYAGASNNPKFDKKTVAEMKEAIKATQEEKATPFVEEAQKRQSAGDFTTSIDNYKKALELVPDKARIWTNLGQAYQSIDDFTNARASYQKAVDLDPKNESTNYYLIAKIDENFGQGNDAIGHYRKYLLANSTGPYANDANARLADLSKNITHCQKLPTSGEIKNQKIAEEEYNIGLAAQKGGNPADALTHYQKASAAKPDESAYVEAIATCYQQLKNYDQALAAYDQAIAIATKNGRTKDVDIYVKQREDCAEEKAGPLVDKALAAYNAKDFKTAADLYGQALLIVPKLPAMHTSRATACQNADDFAGALDEYQKAYDLDPKTQKENLYFIGVLQENFGKGPQALATYRKYLTENAGGQYVAAAKQRVDALSKDVTKTVKLPTTAERQSAEQVSGLYDEAIKMYNSGNYDAAVSKFQAILGISNDAVYHNALGSCYLALKKYDDAKTEFATASKLDPSNKQYKDNLNSILPLQLAPIVDEAVKKQTAGDLAGAIAGYRQALTIDPNSANVYTNLASALQNTEDFAGARSAFEKALTLDRKNNLGNLYFMAVLDENFSKGALALQEYTTYVKEAGAGGAYTALAQGRIKALTANPNDVNKIVTQQQQQQAAAVSQAYQDGIALQTSGKFDEAIAKYTEAISGNPTEAAFIYARGTAYDNKGDYDNAIKDYEKAIAMNPKEKTWKDALKGARQKKAAPILQEAFTKQTTKDANGNYDLAGAIVAYENALKIDDDATAHLNCGTAYQASGNQAKALEHYKKAVTMDGSLVDAYYYMGTVYEAMKQPALAIGEYKKYLAKQPAGPNAAACKDRLKVLGAK